MQILKFYVIKNANVSAWTTQWLPLNIFIYVITQLSASTVLSVSIIPPLFSRQLVQRCLLLCRASVVPAYSSLSTSPATTQLQNIQVYRNFSLFILFDTSTLRAPLHKITSQLDSKAWALTDNIKNMQTQGNRYDLVILQMHWEISL